MSRVRQLHAQNYRTSANISDEFENVIRYLNAVEDNLGDKTLNELLSQIFDSNGEFSGPLEIRSNADDTLQYRIGTYTDAEDGWTDITSISALRGEAGTNVGTVEGAVFYNRQSFTATASQTDFTYAFGTGDDLMVWVNGVLKTETADYTKTQATSLVHFLSGLSAGQVVTIVTIRAGSVTNYRRSDQVATTNQAVFAFPHTSDETLLVYRNGVLQREGGSYDYTTSATSDTVTFTSPLIANDKVSILTVENLALQAVTGLMLESAYTDGAGKIPYAKLSIADGDIAQAKISGLAALLTNRGKVYVQGTEPVSVNAGDMWVKTSASPNELWFYNGTAFVEADKGGNLPTYSTPEALKYLRVNSAGNDLEFANLDLSSRIPLTYMGAASGVATLDATGRIPEAQMPVAISADTIPFFQSGSISATTYEAKFLFKQRVRIDGIVHKLSAGTCTIEITVDGTSASSTYSVTTTKTDVTLGTSISIDASTASKTVGIKVTSPSAATDLRVGLAIANLSG